MKIQDTYQTITTIEEPVVFKDKNSKFFGYAFPVLNEDAVKSHLVAVKKKHYDARHWCYAYQIGTETFTYRTNDDGEPSNSAGMPIYGQIKSFKVTNVLIIIVRYFGGVKLGVGGLIKAYKTAAKMSLNAAKITTKTITINYMLCFDYKHMNTVMRIVKEKALHIAYQKLEINCQITISVRKRESNFIFETFNRLQGIKIEKSNLLP